MRLLKHTQNQYAGCVYNKKYAVYINSSLNLSQVYLKLFSGGYYGKIPTYGISERFRFVGLK